MLKARVFFCDPCRRGSNVSLTLDMCTPGCNEEGFGYLVSPREESAHEYLLSASRILRAEELHEKALDPFLLQAEFFVSSLKWPATFAPPSQSVLQSIQIHTWNRPTSRAHLSERPGQAFTL